MPCARLRSATLRPASPSLTIARICSSVNLLRFIGPPLNRRTSFYAWRIKGGRSGRRTDAALLGGAPEGEAGGRLEFAYGRRNESLRQPLEGGARARKKRSRCCV